MASGRSQNITVCVAGVGACTAIGADASSSIAAIRAGIAGFDEHPYMIDHYGDPMIVARAPYLSEDITGRERIFELARAASLEALSSVNGAGGKRQPIPVIIGLPPQRPGLPEELGKWLTERFKEILHECGLVAEIETIDTGHAAGLMALEAGWQKIRSGRVEYCLVGGIDSYLEPETLDWLDRENQLHNSVNAWGFVPGEAAGFCLLSSARAAERDTLSILCHVPAVVTAREKNLIKTDTVCLGKGLTEAVGQVMQTLPSLEVKVDQTICDLNGEPYRADEFGFTTVRTSERFVDATDFLAPADCWGDVGAASGPLFVSIATAANLKDYAKGPHTLVWASSESGERTAALVYADGRPEGGQ